MSVALNDVCIWRDLLKDLPDLYDDGALLQVRIQTPFFMALFPAEIKMQLGNNITRGSTVRTLPRLQKLFLEL